MHGRRAETVIDRMVAVVREWRKREAAIDARWHFILSTSHSPDERFLDRRADHVRDDPHASFSRLPFAALLSALSSRVPTGICSKASSTVPEIPSKWPASRCSPFSDGSLSSPPVPPRPRCPPSLALLWVISIPPVQQLIIINIVSFTDQSRRLSQ